MVKSRRRELYEVEPEIREKRKFKKEGVGNWFARGVGGLFNRKELEDSGYEEHDVLVKAAVMGERVKKREINRAMYFRQCSRVN